MVFTSLHNSKTPTSFRTLHDWTLPTSPPLMFQSWPLQPPLNDNFPSWPLTQRKKRTVSCRGQTANVWCLPACLEAQLIQLTTATAITTITTQWPPYDALSKPSSSLTSWHFPPLIYSSWNAHWAKKQFIAATLSLLSLLKCCALSILHKKLHLFPSYL